MNNHLQATGAHRADGSAGGPATGAPASTRAGGIAPGSDAPKVFIETFGCQMNDNDTERILGFLASEEGCERTGDFEEADIIILNTCSIRDKAEQKVYSMLGRFKSVKAENPDLLIGVGGCVGSQQGERLIKRIPYLDFVFGPHSIHRLPGIVATIRRERTRVVDVEFSSEIDPGEYGVTQPVDGVKASVSIMRGCNNFCAYCIVPYTRGREVSRPAAEIVEEVRALAGAGVAEVMLLGQNVNSYGKGDGDVSVGSGTEPFAALLRDVCAVEGIRRVRFVTSHPKDISDDLVRLFGEEPKLARHLHLPVQSGSDAVLERMGRAYTRAAYLEKVGRIQGLYPDMAITSDIIVGFPGETDTDFELTMDLIRTVRFDNLFSFAYSPRPGTRAAEFDGAVPPDVSSERLQRLQAAQREITAEKRESLVGSIRGVLIEGPSKQDPGEVAGRTACNNVVNLPLSALGLSCTGEIVDVLITAALPNSLRGEPAFQNEQRSTAC